MKNLYMLSSEAGALPITGSQKLWDELSSRERVEAPSPKEVPPDAFNICGVLVAQVENINNDNQDRKVFVFIPKKEATV